jgi:hypothetical protein
MGSKETTRTGTLQSTRSAKPGDKKTSKEAKRTGTLQSTRGKPTKKTKKG